MQDFVKLFQTQWQNFIFSFHFYKLRPANLLATLSNENFMKKLTKKFIKSKVIQAPKENSQSFYKLDVSLKNQKSDQELFIGHATIQNLTELLIEDIGQLKCNHFYDALWRFYETAYNYCKKWFLLDNPYLKHCQFINVEDRNKRTFDDVIEMKNLYGLVLENPIQPDFLEWDFEVSVNEKVRYSKWHMETRNSLREKSRSTLLYRYNLCFHTEANVPTWQDCFICTYSSL